MLAENVKNLLSIEGGWGFARVLDSLWSCGYDCEWQLFNTKYSYIVGNKLINGIPQNRERVFIIGRLTGTERRQEVFPITRADEQYLNELRQIGRIVYSEKSLEHNSAAGRIFDKDGLCPTLKTPSGGGSEPLIIDDQGRNKKHSLRTEFPTLRAEAHGNDPKVVLSEVKEIGYGISKDGKKMQSSHVYDTEGVSPTLTTGTGGNHQPLIIDDRYGFDGARVYDEYSPTLRAERQGIKVLSNYSPSGHNASRVVDADGIAPTVMENHGTVTAVAVRPVLTPFRKEKRQNGRRMKDDGEPMFTLTAQDEHGVAIYDAYNNNIRTDGTVGTITASGGLGLRNCGSFLVGQPNVAIRKITPREAWRLQGFPDEHFDKVVATGMSNSQLYKQAGNAVSVNISRTIGERLKEIETKYSDIKSCEEM